jgi:hypothetical protein
MGVPMAINVTSIQVKHLTVAITNTATTAAPTLTIDSITHTMFPETIVVSFLDSSITAQDHLVDAVPGFNRAPVLVTSRQPPVALSKTTAISYQGVNQLDIYHTRLGGQLNIALLSLAAAPLIVTCTAACQITVTLVLSLGLDA